LRRLTFRVNWKGHRRYRREVSATIENLANENRLFPPSADFSAQANITTDEWSRAAEDPVAFWEEQARRLSWARVWDTPHSWRPAIPNGDVDADGQAVLSV